MDDPRFPLGGADMKLAMPAALSGLCLMLVTASAYELLAPLPPVAAAQGAALPSSRDAAPTVAYSPPPFAQYASIDARPVFIPSRTPFPDTSGPAGAANASSSDFALLGVIQGTDRSVALLRNRSTSLTVSASLGDVVNGWRVVHISATSVSLSAEGRVIDVGLESPASGQPSAPLPPLGESEPQAAQAPQTATAAQAPPAQPQPAAQPAAATPVPVAQHNATPAPADKGALPHHGTDGTIAAEALKGAPINPATGEPTL